MSIDEVIEKALFDYCLAWRDRSYAIQDRIERDLRATIEMYVAEAVAREREACAKIAEVETYLSRVSLSSILGDDAVSHCHVAAAIRARVGHEVTK